MLKDTQDIRIEDYDYPLPDERIAKFPLKERDHSKLLVYNKGDITERRFYELPEILPQDSLLVFNNTRVIQARLFFQKATGGHVEIFCLEPHNPRDYAQAFQTTGECEWKCLVGNSNKWKEGLLNSTQHPGLHAERIENNGETSIIRLIWDDKTMTFADVLDQCGELPIPPYLHRHTEESDKTTYQTVYSKIKGSVAAPTAGLHFTEKVMGDCRGKGIELEELTLHVGAGTFKPVKSETIKDHTMHSEVISVRKSTIEHLKKKLGHIVAVGTTSVRTLESLYYIGKYISQHPDAALDDLKVGQWTPYGDDVDITAGEALGCIIDYLDRHGMDTLITSTQIIIAPGYEFKIVGRLITNFHQPKSTLLLLISAYLKGDWRRVYDYALSHGFRFLSYGDSSLLEV
jgi:S-adenosylmethionine:tRNA ribosyltransferase-isomerase